MTQKQRFSRQIKKETMAEQVATAIKEAILDSEWQAGEALPTEPELAEQFGVSRAVVRDATRMLAAQGLVEAQHGRGVFVTESPVEPFGEALLLALRRSGATVWDVERFEQLLYPEVFALAAGEASDDEIAAIHQAVADYLRSVKENLVDEWLQRPLEADELDPFMAGYRNFVETVFAATHNQVLQLLAPPLLRLRRPRYWQGEEITTADELLETESAYFEVLVEALESRDPDHARRTVAQLMILPPEAEAAMRQTPVGQVPIIPLDLARHPG